MGLHTEIAWTDHTFNPWIGCTKVSPGCTNCYAERDFDLRKGIAKWGPGQPRHHTAQSTWRMPLKLNNTAVCDKCGESASIATIAGNLGRCPECHQDAMRPPRVFCSSLADWLDDEVPIEWFIELLDLIRRTPNLNWQLLSKRPQNFRPRLEAALRHLHGPCDLDTAMLVVWVRNMLSGWAGVTYCAAGRENYWIGTTIENQQAADERMPELLAIPAQVRFLSCEPLLGPVSLVSIPPINRNAPCTTNALTGETHWPDSDMDAGPRVHWLICGGESGPKARPMHPDWARSLRDQCAEAGVPFLFKQWGEWAHPDAAGFELQTCQGPDGETAASYDGRRVATIHHELVRVGKHAAGRLLDGLEHNAFPAVQDSLGENRPSFVDSDR